MMRAPCKECTKRHATCHADCEEYKKFVKENRELKDQIQQTKIINRAIRDGQKRRGL